MFYHRFYLCELLPHLGFSHPKVRFVSDPLDEAARQRWVQEEWPKILAQVQQLGASLFFGDEVSFALWGSLSYTWALVKTTGQRKGYQVFGAIEFLSGRLVHPGLEEPFTSETYQAFLLQRLAQTPGPVILIQEGAKSHTSRATRKFFAQHTDLLIVYQLPSYSLDYNPIEYLWKKVKVRATHNRYFPEFVKLVKSVDEALQLLASQADEIKRLMGVYTKHLAEPEVA